MDNRRIDIISEGEHALRLGLGLVMGNRKVTHWKIVFARRHTKYLSRDGGVVTTHYEELVEDPKARPTLILLWGNEPGATPLPATLDESNAADFVMNWLQQANYGPQPDHDGDNEPGFRLFTEDWGKVYNHHYGIAGIQPIWAMYGK